ncbi:hypothetical protein DL98DRAFT_465237 [Cadophora sp. DSE1049]|nr:hypothetical protein DL98DRAFT_465237 [Cadophora sp. DSE1049]
MQSIRQIQELNKRELEAGVSPNASWHTDYRDTAYIYIGGLPFELSEGDVVTIFSQYGEPTYINLIRDKETGKSKGFAFLKYEDQRSTDLAVDNLGGTVIMGRTLKVDHTRYKKKDDEAEEGHDLTQRPPEEDEDGEGRRKRRRTDESESEVERPMLKEERELAKLIQDHDDEDPMKAYLVEEKKEEVTMALARLKDGKKSEKSKSRHHHHRSRRHREENEKESGSRRSHHRIEHRERRRSRSRERTPERTAESRAERSRKSGNRDEREESKYRRESPRRQSRDQGGHERSKERPRRREGSVEDRRHPSRRYS